MKKFKKFAYIILIVVAVVLSLIIYSSASKNSGQDENQKLLSEIKYLESKLVDLLNSMNNIDYQNYTISVIEIAEKTNDESNQSSLNSDTKSSSDEGSNSENSSSNNKPTGSSKGENKKFELQDDGVLISEDKISWKNIKMEVERMYTSLPTITLDLYKIGINQEDILSFNKFYDDLTISVKDENKIVSLELLSKLYEYIPKFLKNTNADEIYKTVIETKTKIMLAYSKLDTNDWNAISNDLKSATETYSKIMTNTNIEPNKQQTVNKCYIMINEMQNAVNLQDVSIFLIKYKNLVEEMANL